MTVLCEVERVKMVVVCQSAGTVVWMEYFQKDLTIQKCCVDFLLAVLTLLMVGYILLLGSK